MRVELLRRSVPGACESLKGADVLADIKIGSFVEFLQFTRSRDTYPIMECRRFGSEFAG